MTAPVCKACEAFWEATEDFHNPEGVREWYESGHHVCADHAALELALEERKGCPDCGNTPISLCPMCAFRWRDDLALARAELGRIKGTAKAWLQVKASRTADEEVAEIQRYVAGSILEGRMP